MLCEEYYLPKAEPTRAQHCLRGPRQVSTLNFLCNEAYCYSFECFNHESKNKGIINDASVCLSVCDNVALKRMRCFRRGFYGKACFHAMFHFITGVLAVYFPIHTRSTWQLRPKLSFSKEACAQR